MKTAEDCIFCKIVAGDLPSTKVYEDDDFLCFIDIRPRSPGHSLVIPKDHYRLVWDVPNIGIYFEKARDIAVAMQKVFGTHIIHSKVEGNEVPHAHIWLYPDPKEAQGDPKDFAGNAKKIKEALTL